MRWKYPKGSSYSHSFIHSFLIFYSLSLFFPLHSFVRAVVNFTFSTHIFSGRLLFSSGVDFYFYLNAFLSIALDQHARARALKRTLTHTRSNTHAHPLVYCERNRNWHRRTYWLGAAERKQLIRPCNKSNGKNGIVGSMFDGFSCLLDKINVRTIFELQIEKTTTQFEAN